LSPPQGKDILERVAETNVKSEGKEPAKTAQATPAGAPGQATASPAAQAAQAKALVGGAGRQVKSVAAVFQKFTKRKGNIWMELPQIFPSLFSNDPPTRRMSFLFILSFIGFLGVSSVVIQRYWSAKKEVALRESQRMAKRLGDYVKKETEETKRRASVITMGSFSMELKNPLGRTPANSKVDMAELEVVLLCDDKETREFIEENMVKVRNQMSNILTAVDREELMSRDGKKKMKRLIIRRLNEWLTHGKIEDLYFSKLLLN